MAIAFICAAPAVAPIAIEAQAQTTRAPRPEFVPGFDDLPLMRALAVEPNSVVIFDKPHGRLVQAVAHGHVGRAEVEGFYARVLPQLGWNQSAPLVFRREGETIRIEIDGEGRNLNVRFFLSPGSPR